MNILQGNEERVGTINLQAKYFDIFTAFFFALPENDFFHFAINCCLKTRMSLRELNFCYPCEYLYRLFFPLLHLTSFFPLLSTFFFLNNFAHSCYFYFSIYLFLVLVLFNFIIFILNNFLEFSFKKYFFINTRSSTTVYVYIYRHSMKD